MPFVVSSQTRIAHQSCMRYYEYILAHTQYGNNLLARVLGYRRAPPSPSRGRHYVARHTPTDYRSARWERCVVGRGRSSDLLIEKQVVHVARRDGLYALKVTQSQELVRLAQHALERGQHEDAAVLLRRVDHAADLVELGELAAQPVRVLAQRVGQQRRRRVLYHLLEAEDLSRERRLLLAAQLDGRAHRHELRGRDGRVAQDGRDARACVQQVHRGVALRVEHPLVREVVVGVAVALEVGVLDGAVPQHA
mmetsp:Transcript_13516/g.20323  ORF Transcript_13516/g.20323 Transcript_13516/m.20323 type:complete len:251 (-) Transcript_13516:21-773(-)